MAVFLCGIKNKKNNIKEKIINKIKIYSVRPYFV